MEQRLTLNLVLCIASVLLAGLLRLYNWNSIFHDGGIYFVDADCYSRMTRAAMVSRGEAFSIRHHDFENYPDGTSPHTTGLLDWLIAALAIFLHPFSGGDALDLAGAWIGPLLAVCAAALLTWLLRSEPNAWMTLLLFAISPILVFGTVLGRPDHQALQIFLLAPLFAFRWIGFKRALTKTEAIFAGISLGLALWVSLYEPLVLGVLFLFAELLFNRARLFQRERLWELGAVLAVFFLAILIDGFRWSPPDSTPGGIFSRWSQNIGELRATGWHSAVIQSWIGWLGFVAAGGAMLQSYRNKDARSAAWSLVWIVVLVLAGNQARWGYFLALVTSFLLLEGLSWIPQKWARYAAFFVLLLPVWNSWLDTWHPSEEQAAALMEQKKDQRLLKETALFIRNVAHSKGAILAPWWLSPSLAYWSGNPCIAGSSHQSLPGIEASAKFYVTQDLAEAQKILADRKVSWVVAYEPERVFLESTRLVQKPAFTNSMGNLIWQTNLAPSFLRFAYINDFFRLYEVKSR